MSFQSLLAYKESFALAMKIFEATKSFPKEEKYSLTDQIRKSSRGVSANISEAYRKKLYPKHFIRKLFNELTTDSKEVGKLINYMINNPSKFGV